MAPLQAGVGVLGALMEVVLTVLWRMMGQRQNMEGIMHCAESPGLCSSVKGG